MIQRARTIRQVANAALYFTLRGRTKSGKRIFIALESLGMALVIGLTVLLQTYLQISPATITLDSATYNLIGESRDDTAQ